MRARIPIVLACAALLAVACQDTPTEPVDTPVATSPEFNFMNGPEMTGVVARGEYEVYTIDLFWETPADPWILWMGLKPGDVPSWCGGEVPEDLRAYQEIGAKHGETVIYNEMLKNAPVTVFDLQEHVDYFYEGLGLGEEPYCYAVTRATPIGSGKADFKANDGPGGWFLRWNGTIDYMGETYQFKWSIKNPYTDDPTHHVARVW